MAVGQLGHSEKLSPQALLELVCGQRVSHLVSEAVALFDVSTRSVEQALSALEWDGFISRVKCAGADGRFRVVALTPKGKTALTDPLAAVKLTTLAMRYRNRDTEADSLDPDVIQAKIDAWRSGMWK
jgi:DNA-binding MarR family transcriptional regulator